MIMAEDVRMKTQVCVCVVSYCVVQTGDVVFAEGRGRASLDS